MKQGPTEEALIADLAIERHCRWLSAQGLDDVVEAVADLLTGFLGARDSHTGKRPPQGQVPKQTKEAVG